MPVSRRGLLALALLLPAAAGVPAAAGAEVAPTAPVVALNAGILAVMHAGRTKTFAERAQMLTPVVQQAFDLPRILRNTVGLRFANFAPAAQEQLLDVFTEFTVASYVANFDDFNGERFEVKTETRDAGADQVVRTLIIPTSGDQVKLDYVVHQDGDAWRIVDVLLNGTISRVAVQRSDFRSLLASGQPEPLIASLRDKVARLAAGDTG